MERRIGGSAIGLGTTWPRCVGRADAGAGNRAEAQLIAFAKACERKGMAGSRDMVAKRIAAIDAENAPILAAEEERFMTSRGYVRGTDEPGKRWVRPEESETSTQVSDGEDLK